MATRHIYETGFDEDVSNDGTTPCPECKGEVRTNSVETVCEDCGLVIDEQWTDHGHEWGAHDQDQRKRTDAPLTAVRHGRGFSTEIGRWKDADGNELSGRKHQRLSRMRREQIRDRLQSKAERNLAHGLGEVRRIVSVLELSDSVRDQACQLSRSAQTEGLLRGQSIEVITAASIYGTCRCNGHSRLLDDVVDAARVEQSRVTNAYKTLNTKLELPTQSVRPGEFIPRLASGLDVPAYIRQRARRLTEQSESSGAASGVKPSGSTAAYLHKAGREEGRWLTQTEVAEVASVTATTIRSHRDMLKELTG